MADVTGPIHTLPGSGHTLPGGVMCDHHPDVLAVARVQGETDSFGSEMHDLCQDCLDKDHAYSRAALEEVGVCEWCKTRTTGLRDTRDYEESSCGPVYRVCGPCRQRANERAEEEMRENDPDYFDDSYVDDYKDDYE